MADVEQQIANLDTKVEALIANFNALEARLYDSANKVNTFDLASVLNISASILEEVSAVKFAISALSGVKDAAAEAPAETVAA
jgi:hypothetical protein